MSISDLTEDMGAERKGKENINPQIITDEMERE